MRCHLLTAFQNIFIDAYFAYSIKNIRPQLILIDDEHTHLLPLNIHVASAHL